MTEQRREKAFETVIEAHLLSNGYATLDRDGFDPERAVFPEAVVSFIRETQPKEWGKLETLHGTSTGEQVLADLCKWMDAHGSLATLRHGFKCYGRTLRVAFFKAAHELNPELESRYAANRLGITRQLHFSPRTEKSLDVTISLNGIPVLTAELKNPLTGQNVDSARRQYSEDRDPREVIFEFKRRTLVHFALDTEAVFMTTRLAGKATEFLPCNKGHNNGAGNPPDEAGRTYRTAYLWEEVLQRDSLLDLLARFIHLQVEEKRGEDGRKVKKETMIFPRYHQLQAVRHLVASAREEGVGNNYLIEHSAGSGKSNTIGWLAHRLASLHNANNERIFDSVIDLAPKLPRRRSGPLYNFDDEVRLEYYRLQKISEGSISLKEGHGSPLDGPTEVGTGKVREEMVVLSRLIDIVNERFGTDFNQADQLFFDQIVEAAMADETLKQAAEVNPEDKFELVFKNVLESFFVERMDQNEEIFVRFMNDPPFQKLVTAWLASEAYQRLRGQPGWWEKYGTIRRR